MRSESSSASHCSSICGGGGCCCSSVSGITTDSEASGAEGCCCAAADLLPELPDWMPSTHDVSRLTETSAKMAAWASSLIILIFPLELLDLIADCQNTDSISDISKYYRSPDSASASTTISPA